MPKAGYACGGYRLAVLPAAAAASGMPLIKKTCNKGNARIQN